MRCHADALPMPGMRSPLWIVGAIHLFCTAACGFAAGAAWWPLPQAAWPWVEGLCAATIGRASGLPWWWMPINLLFFPAGNALLGAGISPLMFLGIFCVLLLVNGAAWFQRVPLFLSSNQAAALVLTLLPQRKGFRLIDLGCGTASLLMNLARARPDGQFTGVELAPLPFLWGRWGACRQRGVNVCWGDFWSTDLTDYDVVYAYLSPVPMTSLWEKARREMRPGSLFVSNSFSVPGVPPARAFDVGDRVCSKLYVWRM